MQAMMLVLAEITINNQFDRLQIIMVFVKQHVLSIKLIFLSTNIHTYIHTQARTDTQTATLHATFIHRPVIVMSTLGQLHHHDQNTNKSVKDNYILYNHIHTRTRSKRERNREIHTFMLIYLEQML